MKTFEECNYYEMLKVPANAGPQDIKCAYRDALDIYDGDALATYSLFTDEQRADLLTNIEKAFATLSVRSKRTAYNRFLIKNGQATTQDFFLNGQKLQGGICQESRRGKTDTLYARVKKKYIQKETMECRDDLLSKQRISGSDLKAFRRVLGVQISDMYAITKISASVIQAIEGNQYGSLPAKIYLKRFLQSYAEVLQIDPHYIVAAYLKCMNGYGKS